MTSWQGKRLIAVTSACMRSDGCPDFAFTEVEVTFDEYENGVHYDLVRDRLADAGYEEPYVHFDIFEGPAFLHAAVRRYLAIDGNKAGQPIELSEEEP